MINTVDFRTIYHVNDALCISTSLVANLTLLYLIIKKTPVEMREYRKILLQNCVIDLLLICSIVLCGPVIIASRGFQMLVNNGFFPDVPIVVNFIFAFWYLYFVSLSSALIPVPFVYRYLVLVKDKDIQGFAYLKLYIIPVLITTILLVSQCALFYPTEEKLELAKTVFHNVFIEKGVDHFSTGYIGTLANTGTSAVCMFVICNGAYSVVTWCSIKIYKDLKVKMATASAKTREMQSQLTRVLIAQAVGPMVVFLAPVMFFAYYIATMSDQIALTMTYGLPMAWVPLANPIVTIWFMKPYRNALFRIKPKNILNPNISSTKIFVVKTGNVWNT